MLLFFFFFFKQKTAYEMRISDWSSDVCSSDLTKTQRWSRGIVLLGVFATSLFYGDSMITPAVSVLSAVEGLAVYNSSLAPLILPAAVLILLGLFWIQGLGTNRVASLFGPRSEEHTSELQSLMRISYAVFCFKKKN